MPVVGIRQLVEPVSPLAASTHLFPARFRRDDSDPGLRVVRMLPLDQDAWIRTGVANDDRHVAGASRHVLMLRAERFGVPPLGLSLIGFRCGGWKARDDDRVRRKELAVGAVLLRSVSLDCDAGGLHILD